MKQHFKKKTGFTIIETLASITLINFLLLVIWTLFLSYQMRMKELMIQSFLITTAINYQEIHLADPLYFSNPDNLINIDLFEEVEEVSYGLKYNFYYNDNLEIVPKEKATILVRIIYQKINIKRIAYWLTVDSYNLKLNDRQSNYYYFHNFYVSKTVTTWLGENYES